MHTKEQKILHIKINALSITIACIVLVAIVLAIVLPITLNKKNDPNSIPIGMENNPMEVKAGENESKSVLVPNGRSYYLVFNPPSERNYLIKIEGKNAYAYIYKEKEFLKRINTVDIQSNTASTTLKMSKNVKYYIVLELYDKMRSDYVDISILSIDGSSLDSAFTLSLGTQAVTTSKFEQVIYFKYAPTVTKTYSLKTIGSFHMSISIYNSNGIKLSFTNANLADGNAKLDYELEKDKTYYFTVKMLLNNQIGTFQVELS